MSGLPRLLAGCHETRALTLDEHAGRHGPVADAPYRGAALIDEVATGVLAERERARLVAAGEQPREPAHPVASVTGLPVTVPDAPPSPS